MLHPLINKNGMILWKGISPASGNKVILSYKKGRKDHSICPKDFIHVAEALGLDIRQHWISDLASKGVMALWEDVAIEVLPSNHSSKYENTEIPLFIREIANLSINNKSMVHVLKGR